MYCNYPVELKGGVIAIVTEIKENPGQAVPISIRAGYAFDRDNNPMSFYKRVSPQFVDTVIEKYGFGEAQHGQL